MHLVVFLVVVVVVCITVETLFTYTFLHFTIRSTLPQRRTQVYTEGGGEGLAYQEL